ncbi:MAG: prolyl-tRNA synthetase associated domain-containing protein [Paludibacteraceae bacterium]|nr:prolyl-tRNA synthetase associated domain-containing protein [Paludibacteraceae bacterium]
MDYISQREQIVLEYLDQNGISYQVYHHPEGKTIIEAKQWWRNDGSVHCKNIFLRNHKGDQHYLVCFDCEHDLDIHDLEQRLKAELIAHGENSPGKLSFASPERMERYLGLEPGSVSPFGLINDKQQHVILFLDENLQKASSLSFHPNDCRGTVVISKQMFEQYLSIKGNRYRYMSLYECR